MKKEKKKRLRKLRLRREEREERGFAKHSAGKTDGIYVEGKLSVTIGGFGFLALDKEEKLPDGQTFDEVFIPAKFIGDAMNGDRVKAELLEPLNGDERGPAGRVVKVLERARTEFIGELMPRRMVRPLNVKLPEIEADRMLLGAKKGDYVRISVTGRDPHSGWKGKVTEVLGRAGVISADLDAVAAEYDLAEPYSEEFNQLALAVVPREMPGREDRRDQFVITLDPFDAKDFDDALSIGPSPVPGCVEIGVYISDVAAYVAPRSKFDSEAAKRAFSCYLPGRTLPMLPKALTAKISMQQGADSLSHTVFLTVESDTGKVVKFRRCHTLLQVRKRLNYEEVQDFIDNGTSPADWSNELKDNLQKLIDVTRKMRHYRKVREQFLNLELPEIRVICDEKENRILGLNCKISRESEAVVEECMLAANSAVGAELLEKKIPGIFRVHAAPEEEKVMEFSAFVSTSFGVTPGDLTVRRNCNKFLANLPDTPLKPVILSLFLRSLPRAEYHEKNDLHFGLGKTGYCHFTSPIRRYTDLTVHQQLWNLDTNARLRSANSMAKVALNCTAKEENSDAAYFAANDKLKLRYLEELDEKGLAGAFTGVVIKTTPAGYQVDVRELGMYGFVPLEELTGREVFQVGDVLKLRFSAIDQSRKSAEFVPDRSKPDRRK